MQTLTPASPQARQAATLRDAAETARQHAADLMVLYRSLDAAADVSPAVRATRYRFLDALHACTIAADELAAEAAGPQVPGRGR